MTDATAEARWAALPDSHPAPGKPGTNRVPAVRTGNLVFLSGHGPAPGPDGVVPAGKVGPGGRYTEAEGAQIARSVGLAHTEELTAHLARARSTRRDRGYNPWASALPAVRSASR